MTSAEPDVRTPPVVVDVEAAQRFEASIDGALAGYTEYVLKYGRLALIHTQVLPDFEGRGVGSALARFALDDARRRGIRVIATCPFVRAYVQRHPETHDIVIGMTPAVAPDPGETG